MSEIPDIPAQTTVLSLTAPASDIPQVYDRGAAGGRPQRPPGLPHAPARPPSRHPRGWGVPSAGRPAGRPRALVTRGARRPRQAGVMGADGAGNVLGAPGRGAGTRAGGGLGAGSGVPLGVLSLPSPAKPSAAWASARTPLAGSLGLERRTGAVTGGAVPGGLVSQRDFRQCLGARADRRAEAQAPKEKGVPASPRGHPASSRGAPQGDAQCTPQDGPDGGRALGPRCRVRA